MEVIDAKPAHKRNYLIDSSLILHTDEGSVYFTNDNPPYPAVIRHLQQYRFELTLPPASGGSGYPACYTNSCDAPLLYLLLNNRFSWNIADAAGFSNISGSPMTMIVSSTSR